MMLTAVFPLDMLSEQANLLTAIVLGFAFGFALERAGFGSARKLAAQFYLFDMSVFKVMFTAILVAMVGFYAGVAVGLVDTSRMWINPTFMWAQLVGGFLLGVGFIVSGLCPGTSVVAAASGHLDALAALAGVFTGTFLFALLIDWFPALHRLYESGSMGVSVLPALLKVPAPWLALAVVLVAGAAFVGVEKVERRFGAGAPRLEPPSGVAGRGGKLALIGSLAAIALVTGFAPPQSPAPQPATLTPIEPLQLAAALVARDPNLLVLDVRSESAAGKTIPGALRAQPDSTGAALVEGASITATIVLIDADGSLAAIPAAWPRAADYRLLRGGYDAWTSEVLTPHPLMHADADESARIERQNALAAWFSGARLESAPKPPPPAAAGTGAPKKKKAGGC